MERVCVDCDVRMWGSLVHLQGRRSVGKAKSRNEKNVSVVLNDVETNIRNSKS